MAGYHLVILPSKDDQVYWQSGIGTGGYIISKLESGIRFSYKSNPNYFKTNRVHFDEVEVIARVDTTARQDAIMNGEVHAINRGDPKTVHLL